MVAYKYSERPLGQMQGENARLAFEQRLLNDREF